MRTKVMGLGMVALLVSVGCGGSKKSGCPTGGTGTLDVAISGLPVGVLASVTVDGVASAVTSSGSISVAGGARTIAVTTVAEPSTLVRSAYAGSADANPVCARDGKTATVHVTYALVPSSHKLWSDAGNGNTELAGFAESLLGASAATPPTASVIGTDTAAAGLAFDLDGNLWVADSAGALRRYSAASLGASATVTPDREITSSALSSGAPGASALAFDATGNLWVATVAAKTIVQFTPAQLAASGAPTPAISVGGGTAITPPAGMAFDAAGNLWIGTDDGIVRYDAAHLAASTTAAPDLIVNAQTTVPASLGGGTGLAFDAAGNLWVSYFGPNVIAKLTPANLTGTGTTTPTPAVQITLNVSALLDGLAFDEAGGLWTPYSAGKIARLSPAQLTASGTVTPATILDATASGSFAAMAFYPAATGVPLYDALP